MPIHQRIFSELGIIAMGVKMLVATPTSNQLMGITAFAVILLIDDIFNIIQEGKK